MSNKYIKTIRITLTIIGIIIVLFLIIKDINLTGNLTLKTDFQAAQPRISILGPAVNIDFQNSAKIINTPVYFEILLPRDYDKVRLQFTFDNDINFPIEIGADLGNSWDLKSLENGQIDFSLANKNIVKGRLRFSLDAPYLDSSGKNLIINNLTVKLSRKSVSDEGLFNNLKNYLRFYKNEIIK